jgi:uncharacterized protein YndB with AHSA1/START domain
MSSQPQTRATIATPGEREIVIERIFDAPRERVWAAWTQAELIARWWGRRHHETRVDELDLRPGGKWRFVELGDDGSEEVAFRGVYREVSAPSRLSYTFEWEGMPGHVSVDTLDLEALDGATKLVSHTIFHTRQERDGMIEAGMEKGLNEGYEQLDELLAEMA